MGNAQTIEANEVARTRPGDWTAVAQGHSCEIVESQALRVRAEQYTIPLSEKTWELDNINIYEFRRVQTSHLVKVYSVEQDAIKGNLVVRTELIPYRLADIVSLTPDESLYVALYSLIGYRYIYELCGRRLFSVSDAMIGFTPEGLVKVWINPNFAINEADKDALK